MSVVGQRSRYVGQRLAGGEIELLERLAARKKMQVRVVETGEHMPACRVDTSSVRLG